MISDACICVNESSPFSLTDFSDTAFKNGYRRIVVCGAVSDSPLSCEVISGTRISAKTVKELLAAAKKAPKGNVVIADVGDNSFNRTAITTKGIHLLAGLDALPKAGFEHITAKMAAQHRVGLVIELGKIIDPKTRRSALSHYADILKLQRKYQFPLVIASAASAPAGQKNLQETVALCSLFGMERAEVYAALNAVDGILHPPKTVEVVE
ncbi:MAG: hypothetical protein IKY81_00725 [Methanocorpusculum sp.]|nr:hypothetical protein [Methanocorpusculum sp.]